MRNLLVALLISLTTMGVHAWEPTTADFPQEIAVAQDTYSDAVVSITPVPMPARVIELANYSPIRTSIGQVKKLKVAKVANVKSMLSRSNREQISLARTSTKPDERVQLSASEDEDTDTGIDELDLHRSYSQLKVAKLAYLVDDDEAVIDLPDHIKLRLLMARTKAIENHMLSQANQEHGVTEDVLSESVKIRLLMARARAVKAHSEKYGELAT